MSLTIFTLKPKWEALMFYEWKGGWIWLSQCLMLLSTSSLGFNQSPESYLLPQKMLSHCLKNEAVCRPKARVQGHLMRAKDSECPFTFLRTSSERGGKPQAPPWFPVWMWIRAVRGRPDLKLDRALCAFLRQISALRAAWCCLFSALPFYKAPCTPRTLPELWRSSSSFRTVS